MSIKVEIETDSKIPVEVEGITPCRCRELSLDQIKRLPIYRGNEALEFGELFRVSGSAADEDWHWSGQLSSVHWLGTAMTSGSIAVKGNIGRHLGSSMQGGTIQVEGDASDWVGAEMQGGHILVSGRAGHLIGAAYRGSPVGMNGGWIVIGKDAGNEIGHTMRRGLIAIGGSAGDLIGFNMLAGTILVFGSVGIRHGAGMVRGTIGLLGEAAPMLPSFKPGCVFRPPMLLPILRKLESYGMAACAELAEQSWQLHHGDFLEGGRGEILTPVA